MTLPDELVRGEHTHDDFFNAVLALDRPVTADEVADLARGHGVDTAFKCLAWFVRMDSVTRASDSLVTYECNQKYLQWRRVQRFRDRYITDELLELLEVETERNRSYAAEFDVESPEAVSISAYASATGRPLKGV